MKKYEVRCQGDECGVTLGSVELPDDRPLTDQASGYYCQDCGKKLRANIGSRAAALPGVSPEQQARLEVFKTKIGGKATIAPSDLDELVAIFFRK